MREIDVLAIDVKVQSGEIAAEKLEDALGEVVKWISESIRQKHLYDGTGLDSHDYTFMDKIDSCIVKD